MIDWTNSQLYKNWRRSVVEPPKNDFVMLITASSKTPVSGTGKSTLLAWLGKQTDRTESGFDASEKATLDVGELAYELEPKLNSGSAIVGDEIQGTPGAEGFDGRRAMKQEVIDGISAILANRNKNYTIILGAQQFSMLDPRLIPVIDAWLLIRDEPPNPVGTYHKVYVEDYNLKSPDLRTPAVEDFTWDALQDDEDYHTLEELKEEAKTQGGDSEDEEDKELSNEVQARIAQQFRNAGRSLRWISENVDEVTYSRNWISEHTQPADDSTGGKTA